MSAGENYHKASRIACRDHNGVAALVHGGVPTVGGGRYDQRYCMIWTITDVKFTHFFEMLDTYMVETALYRLKYRIERPMLDNPFDVGLVGPAENPGGTRDGTIRVAERLLSALRNGDLAAYASLFTEDLVANVVGRTPFSGRFRGRDAYLATDFDFHGNLLRNKRIGDFYRIMVADGNAFCMLVKGDAETLSGKPYHQDYCVVGQIAGDRISELHVWLDTAHVEEALFDNHPVSGERKPPVTAPFSIY